MTRAFLSFLILIATGSALRAAPPGAPEIWRDFTWPATATGTPVLVDCLALVATNEWSTALARIEAQLISNPQDAGALHLAGLLFWHSGNREEATRRLVKASRAPDARPITLWTLAALSGQARSQAEAVGWIKRAARGTNPAEVEQWLRKPCFADLCEFPPFRELLATLDLSSLCPSLDIGIYKKNFDSEEDSIQALMRKEGPQPSMRLSVQEPLAPQRPLDSDAAPGIGTP
jgi:hypothetical protein